MHESPDVMLLLLITLPKADHYLLYAIICIETISCAAEMQGINATLTHYEPALFFSQPCTQSCTTLKSFKQHLLYRIVCTVESWLIMRQSSIDALHLLYILP